MSTVEPVAAKRSKAHVRYKLADGTNVPGVTTVLGILAKPALVPWANNLGLQGIKVKDYVDVLAEIGTIAHEMILCYHENRKFEPGDRPADLIDKAENCLLSYFNWEKGHKIEPILCEAQLVSRSWKFGGTLDMYANVDGIPTLLDYKTGKAIYPEYFYQCAAYRNLLMEIKGEEVNQVRILQVGRDETEGFSEASRTDTSREWEIFKHCLALYNLKVGK